MKSRITSKSPLRFDKITTGLFVHVHQTMAETVGCARLGQEHYAHVTRRRQGIRTLHEEVFTEAETGGGGVDRLVELADRLIDEAILIDPRLNHKHGWVRSEEGVDACPSLVSAGEPACCLDRRKIGISEQSTAEPVKIVLSTDSKESASESNVVAFIAATKLAQQFRPLEIWWQGAWLEEPDIGVVLLAPIIQGDMDFARVKFVLSNRNRDSFSFRCMWYHAATKHSSPTNLAGYKYGGERGAKSYLDGTFDFVPESGIRCQADYIATLAAKWAGLDPLWSVTIDEAEALQYWRKPSSSSIYSSVSDAERARWKREEEARLAAKKAAAEARLASL